MSEPKLYAANWIAGRWKFHRLSDGAPSRGPRKEFVIHLATGKLWVKHHEALEKVGAQFVAIPRSYLRQHPHIF